MQLAAKLAYNQMVFAYKIYMRLDVKPKESVRHPSQLLMLWLIHRGNGTELGTEQRRERERESGCTRAYTHKIRMAEIQLIGYK